MRKASRKMDAAFALEVLDKAPYVTISMTRPNGTPYGLPLSLARTDERTFYFHCALEGDKLDCIAHNPTVFPVGSYQMCAYGWPERRELYVTVQVCYSHR